MIEKGTKKKYTVLFVDDEPNILQGLQNNLRKENFQILTANSGEQALEILARTAVDVVVSDEQMPGMSGSEFLSEVCRRHPATIRITLTGQSTLDSAFQAISQGEIYRFLTKPCSATEIAQTIHRALQVRDLMSESSRLLSMIKS